MEYCERLGVGFWAEPFNALTNAAFLITALLLFRLLRYRQQDDVSWEIYILVLLIASVGLGSFLWHTLATQWAELADKLPIFAFMLVYFSSYMARVLRLTWFWVLFWIVLFLLLNVAVKLSLPVDLFNGSIMYLPALLALLMMAFASFRQRRSGAMIIFALTGLFCVAVMFRSVDQLLCDSFSLGSHFVWHLLNAVMLYWLMRVLINRAHNTCQPDFRSI